MSEEYGVVHSHTRSICREDAENDALLLAKRLVTAALIAMHSIKYGVNDAEWVSLVLLMEDVEYKISVAHIGKDAIDFRWKD